MSQLNLRSISARRLLWFAFIALSLPVPCSGQTNRPNVPDRIEALADQLLITKSSEERTDLVAANKELITTDLRRVLIKHGNVLLTAGQYSQAFDVYGVAKFVAEQIGDKEGIATSSLDIGTVYYFQANYVAALEHYRKAREVLTQLMSEFHGRLKESAKQRGSQSRVTALQASALSLRRSTEYQHPYYWAGFALIGDGR